MEILFVFRHGFKEFYDHRKCDRSGYDIRDGLGYLNSGESRIVFMIQRTGMKMSPLLIMDRKVARLFFPMLWKSMFP